MGPDVVVIGGSAGGLKALEGILATFRIGDDTAVFVVLHRPPRQSPLVELLQRYTTAPVSEPDDSPWPCRPGTVTVAPAGYHLLVGNARTVLTDPPTPITQYETGGGVRAHLTLDASVAYSRPSIDVAFRSAAELVNSVTVVMLSCANDDGAWGCEVVKASGGRVVLQTAASCEAAVAVNAASRRVQPDLVADPQAIGRWLSRGAG